MRADEAAHGATAYADTLGIEPMTRRDWLRATGAAAVAAMVPRERAESSTASSPRGFEGKLCFFSKHLGELGWADMASAVKEAGFDAVDLTVRPKGHVEPERVADDLPRAVEAIKRAALDVPMITTALTSADDPAAKPTLAAARAAGIRYFKPGYYRYALEDVRAEIADVGRKLEGLAALARDAGVEMGFHNHERNVGAAVWDVAPVIDRLDPRWTGYYFDPRHAVVEGGGIAWKVATQLVLPRLKMVAVKDFYWTKTAKGWQIHDCPLGQGMVDWTWFTAALARARFAGPISFHFEYETGGATAAERTTQTLEAARRDLQFLRDALSVAYR